MDYYIDNYNFKGFGIYVQESTGVVDLPKFKPPTETDWAEYHGVIIDSDKTPRTEARTIQLKCFLKAENQVDFLTKLSAFQSVFMTKGLKRLAIILTNEVGLFFDVYMSDGLQVTKRWSDSTMVGQFTVNLCEPEPIKKIIRFDSQGSASTLSFKTSEAVSVYWGDCTYQHDLYGNVSLSKTYDESGIYFAIIHGNVDNITDLTTNGDVLGANNGGNIEIEVPEILNDALESVELFNVAEPGISQITPYIRFAFNNNGATRYLRITIEANDEWLEQIAIINNRLDTMSTSITTLQSGITTINNKIGSANGIAELDTNGKVPQSQLPSFVDDVEEYSTFSNFPATGESGKIYIATDTNITYRWGGSTYVPIGSDLALGETASTAYRGDRGKTAYDHSRTQGNPHNTTIAQISGLQTALDEKQPTIGKNEFLKQVSDLDNYNAENGEIVEYAGTTGKYTHGYIYERDSAQDVDLDSGIVKRIINHSFTVGDKTYPAGIYWETQILEEFENRTFFYTNGTFAWLSPGVVGETLININNEQLSYIVTIDSSYSDNFPLTDDKGNNVRNQLCSNGRALELYEMRNANGDYLYSINRSKYFCIKKDGKLLFNLVNDAEYTTQKLIIKKWNQLDVQPHQDTSSIENPTWTDESGTYSDVPSSNNIQSGWSLSAIFARIKKWFASLKKVAFSGSYNDLINKPQNATITTAGLMSAEDKIFSTDLQSFGTPIIFSVPTYKCVLIADITTFWNSSSSTLNLPAQGFCGFAIKFRNGGNIQNASADITAMVSYQNNGGSDHQILTTSNAKLTPHIVSYDNKIYISLDYGDIQNHYLKLLGTFYNCLSTPLQVNQSDCTLVV